MTNDPAAARGQDPSLGSAVERLQGHGVIRRGDVELLATDYDVIITPAHLRGTGITYEAGLPTHEPKLAPDITGRLLGGLYQAQPFAEDVHTLVLEDGREFDFRVLQPDTNEIVGVSDVRPAADPSSRAAPKTSMKAPPETPR